jgi:hypothetical protein
MQKRRIRNSALKLNPTSTTCLDSQEIAKGSKARVGLPYAVKDETDMRQDRTILFAGIVIAAIGMTWLILSISHGPPPRATLVPVEENSDSESDQGAATSVGPSTILIDFSVYPENHANAEPIIVERGVARSIPLVVEAPNDAEGFLRMQITSGAGIEAEMSGPNLLNAELTQTTIALSTYDLAEGKVTELTASRGIRDAGTLTLNPPLSTPTGEYSFMIEVRQQPDSGLVPASVSGTMVYVTVK